MSWRAFGTCVKGGDGCIIPTGMGRTQCEVCIACDALPSQALGAPTEPLWGIGSKGCTAQGLPPSSYQTNWAVSLPAEAAQSPLGGFALVTTFARGFDTSSIRPGSPGSGTARVKRGPAGTEGVKTAPVPAAPGAPPPQLPGLLFPLSLCRV